MEDSETKKFEKIAAHKMSICQRTKIQELVDFASPRLAFHEMHFSPFTTNHFVSEHFNLISIDGAPLSKMAMCKNCKTVLVRFRKGTTNLKVHQKRHVKSSQEMKTTKRKNLKAKLVLKLGSQWRKSDNPRRKKYLSVSLKHLKQFLLSRTKLFLTYVQLIRLSSISLGHVMYCISINRSVTCVSKKFIILLIFSRSSYSKDRSFMITRITFPDIIFFQVICLPFWFRKPLFICLEK